MFGANYFRQQAFRRFSTWKIPTALQRKHVMKPSFACATTDAGFKRLFAFANQSIIISILNSLVPAFKDNKITRIHEVVELDLKVTSQAHVTTTSGADYLVEVQPFSGVRPDKQSLIYACDGFFEQPNRAGCATPVVAVQLFGYGFDMLTAGDEEASDMIDQAKHFAKYDITSIDQYLNHYHFTKLLPDNQLADLHIAPIDLPAANKLLNLGELHRDSSLQHWWLSLLCHSKVLSKGQVNNLAAKGMPTVVVQAAAALELTSWEWTEACRYRTHLYRAAKALQDENTNVFDYRDGFEDGLQEGMRDGHEAGLREGTQRVLRVLAEHVKSGDLGRNTVLNMLSEEDFEEFMRILYDPDEKQ